MISFESLHLAAPLLKALQEEGYTTPTPIQAKAIPPILEGKDMLGCAQTGTGKTAAFALPMLHRMLSAPVDRSRRGPLFPRALILSPTRELCTQIGDSFATYGRHTGLVHTCVYGGVSQFHQVKALHRGIDILVATPGRLMDLMEQRLVNLSDVTMFVLDEADRMLDMGFIHPIRRIAAALPNKPESPRQTLLFSATMPGEIMHLADSLLRSPVKVAVTPVASAAPLISQALYLVPKLSKQALLHHLLETENIERAVVFTKTKHGADRVSRRLRRAGISADEIHGNKAQNARQRALERFRSGRSRVLVATDVAARGLDVDGISHVFNFDLPMEPESYVHRIGRTGRAGATGIAVSFCDQTEHGLLRDIERLTGKKIAPTPLPKDMAALEPDDHPRDSRFEQGPPQRQQRSGHPSAERSMPRQAGGHGGERRSTSHSAAPHAPGHSAPHHRVRDEAPARPAGRTEGHKAAPSASHAPAHTPSRPAAPAAERKHEPAAEHTVRPTKPDRASEPRAKHVERASEPASMVDVTFERPASFIKPKSPMGARGSSAPAARSERPARTERDDRPAHRERPARDDRRDGPRSNERRGDSRDARRPAPRVGGGAGKRNEGPGRTFFDGPQKQFDGPGGKRSGGPGRKFDGPQSGRSFDGPAKNRRPGPDATGDDRRPAHAGSTGQKRFENSAPRRDHAGAKPGPRGASDRRPAERGAGPLGPRAGSSKPSPFGKSYKGAGAKKKSW